jgi:sulfonate transport system permease protein
MSEQVLNVAPPGAWRRGSTGLGAWLRRQEVSGLLPGRFGLRRIATPLAVLILWQAASSTGVLPARVVPPPLAVLLAARDLLLSGALIHHLSVSLLRVAAGLAIAILAGASLALAAGLSRLGEDLIDPSLQMARTLPFLALVPLFILWFGIGETPKVALVALGATFPIYLNLFAGIRGADPKLVEVAATLGLSRAGLIRHVVLPAALPHLLTGLRYAIGIAWLSLVVGEQINADSGIGYLMMDARDFLRTDIIMVGLAVYALLGLASDQAVRALERKALAWRPAAKVGR